IVYSFGDNPGNPIVAGKEFRILENKIAVGEGCTGHPVSPTLRSEALWGIRHIGMTSLPGAVGSLNIQNGRMVLRSFSRQSAIRRVVKVGKQSRRSFRKPIASFFDRDSGRDV